MPAPRRNDTGASNTVVDTTTVPNRVGVVEEGRGEPVSNSGYFGRGLCGLGLCGGPMYDTKLTFRDNSESIP